MIQVDMSASKRESFGKCAMRRLRVSGNTPAVLYGNDKESIALQLETAPFLKRLFQISRKNAVVNLAINGDDTRHVMMREIQTDPVNDSLIHADFFEIDLAAPRCFAVTIDLVGKAKGLDFGGALTVHNASVKVEGLPLKVPDSMRVDITDLNIGDSIKLSDLQLPDGVKMVSDGSALCVEITTAQAELVVSDTDEEAPQPQE